MLDDRTLITPEPSKVDPVKVAPSKEVKEGALSVV